MTGSQSIDSVNDLERSIFLPKKVTDSLEGIDEPSQLERVVFAHWLARGAFAGLTHEQRLAVEGRLSLLRKQFYEVGETSTV